MRLTDLRIKQLQPPNRGQKTHFDDALPGFGVRVSQGGSKSFVVMYGERRRLKTLGRYPALSLAEARIAAKRVQADTYGERHDITKPESITFSTARVSTAE